MPERILLLLLLAVFNSCGERDSPGIAQAVPEEQFPGGANGTVFDFSQNAFGGEVNGLSSEQAGFFVTGNSFFRSNWVSAPASVQSLDGLGPPFNGHFFVVLAILRMDGHSHQPFRRSL